MSSRFFIERPIFAAVLSIIIVLAGLVALKILPIAQYPEIAPPTVTITANYPGASAETLAKTVAAPIEEQLSGVENLLYFSSTSSSDGSLTITATFEVGTDIDKATFNVNNRVQLATPRLPDEVRRNGVVVAKRSENFLLVIALTSPNGTRDELFLSNYATQNILDELKRIPGTAEVLVFGARDYSMRVWLQPDKMAQLGVTTSDIAAAINAQNAQYAAGKIGADPAPKGQELVYTVTARGRLVEPEEFGEIVLRSTAGGGVLRLKDVARIELGAQSYAQSSTVNGQPAIAIGVFLQSGANALDVADAVKAKMVELRNERFPDDVDYRIPYDTTRFVSASINEVMHTVIEAAIIVLLVVFVFLQTWRATLIPMLAVPVSLIGTFAGLWLFGFSINTLTLFAMVLAIGIVVDDAIVVLENVERLMREEKMSPFAAAVEAMREVSGAVIGIVLVLCAVFIPVAFMGGIAGQLYRQFAVTVAIAVVLSGIVALTLTPSLCALLLKPHHDGVTWGQKFFAPFNRGFDWLTKRFLGGVSFALKRRLVALLGFVLMLGVASYLLWRVPGSFVPEEDQGFILSAVVLPDGATLERTERTTEQLRQMNAQNDAIDSFFIINGFDLIGGGAKSNSATIFVTMKPWDERTQSTQELAQQVSGMGFALKDGIAFAFNPPGIQGLGQAGGFEVYVQARSDSDPQRLAQVTQDFMAALMQHPVLGQVQTFYRPTVPQLRVEVDREKALALGVPVNEVFAALQAQMGSLYVNDFNRSGRTYRVTIQADAPFRSKPEDLGRLYVRSQTTGQMVPLKTLIRVDSVIGPEQIERYNSYVAAKVMGSAKPGYSSGEAIKAVEEVARQVLPQGYSYEWTGQAFQEKRTGSASVFAFGFALVMVYLILSALYERWGVPFAVVLAVPFAVTGALLAVWLRGMENDIYFQIGLVVLIGLAAKNAILIAEFAMQGMEQGKKAAEAALEAARLRFRPIVMTSLAFVLGVVPLVFATGAGAAARQSMGTGVFGGMLVATFVAPIFVPLFFALLARKPRPQHSHAPGATEEVPV
ncbi:efflux RND transporter permease subunit [Caldimonas thermodepolymerans]|jgi:The (Largely Gram-negative Bacterial) Hydrophobe/Amphiphile Efflux-1 (HAE1) Family|uniref:Efflux pump membrane transporter n=1 Tax=Caldimonas thermodepolymerans TaxID=215580 RepID=A0AA46DED2_9BURK|nr:multidrug efflux RND transporter permease subunit [Caldimonas thermodepolymerans]TCP07546.1 multidrug efflux pump [Caldimonas thermodepolymerans]UZG44052.1 multidrug efflux RND transporter permease subunit [Caldimonas thermodepolymerans]UZG47718.1 multidrug efflux RND transporter permease subunit [Caldimonas thermodepolymerans]